MNDNQRNKICAGKLAQEQLLDDQKINEAAALLARVADSNLETIRVLFADQHGILRGKTIVASAFESVFTRGLCVPSTLLLKDTSHRTVFPVWSEDPGIDGGMAGAGDILLIPDPATFRILPWSEHSAWIFCEPRFKSGSQIPFSPRGVLQRSIDKLADAGYAMLTGLELEFHVFEVVDRKLDHAGSTMPGQPVVTRNLAQGYQFLTEHRYDTLEHIVDELRRHCQSLQLPIHSMEIEMGPSQLEFTFEPADPMTHADNTIMFRTMVKEVCARKGLHATFMCKPKIENSAASGWHLHQSVLDLNTRRNLMVPTADNELSDIASAWIAGLLEHVAECCLLTTPTVNGYKRYRPHQLAPDRIQWGRDNRGAMIRALTARSDNASRIENRVAEPAANPYYYFASQILSGLDGIKRGMQAPAAVETPYNSNANTLPDSLLSAIELFENSAFLRGELGDVFVDYLSRIRRSEWDRYHSVVSEWEQAEYFGLY
ncbi:glutamine synthetase [Chromatiales bacterium (ex Bugula neritina AB1)]|nr:glutamine synthetase [Chromatiales bacterium (ex Bugula neritina AB1)]